MTVSVKDETQRRGKNVMWEELSQRFAEVQLGPAAKAEARRMEQKLDAACDGGPSLNVAGSGWGIPPAGIDVAGAARGSAGMPLVAQGPLAGNGAHSVSSSAGAGCAHEFAGERAEADASRLTAVQAERSESTSQAPASMATTFPAIEYQGPTVVDLGDLRQAVNRAAAVDRVIERMSQVCPQSEDCAGPVDNKQGCRVYECDECDFKGCAACIEIHESEPHWTDSATARERGARIG
jgi:hypothetical protein